MQLPKRQSAIQPTQMNKKISTTLFLIVAAAAVAVAQVNQFTIVTPSIELTFQSFVSRSIKTDTEYVASGFPSFYFT